MDISKNGAFVRVLIILTPRYKNSLKLGGRNLKCKIYV